MPANDAEIVVRLRAERDAAVARTEEVEGRCAALVDEKRDIFANYNEATIAARADALAAQAWGEGLARAAQATLDHCDTCGGVLDTMPCLHCEADDPECECGGTGMIDCPECEGRRTRLRAALAAGEGGGVREWLETWLMTARNHGASVALGVADATDLPGSPGDRIGPMAAALASAPRPDRAPLSRLVEAVARDAFKAGRLRSSYEGDGHTKRLMQGKPEPPDVATYCVNPAALLAAAQERMRKP